MRYHQNNYQATPSIWNAEDWVPWLVSAIFVSAEMILCFLVVMIATILNLIEYLMNNALNYGTWLVNSAGGFIPWLGGWLTWLAESALNISTALGQQSSELANLALILGGGIPFLFAFLPRLALSLAVDIINGLLEAYNSFVNQGWNPFMSAIGAVVSEVVDLLVWIWNTGLFPFLLSILESVIPGGLIAGGIVGSVVNLFLAFWDLLWAVVMWLWENVFQTINIPLSFYNGLADGLNSSAFSNLLSCDGSTTNFWCNFLAGLDLLNNIAGHSIFYPIVIAGIIVGTITIIYRNGVALWEFYSEFLSRL